ncbi:Conserved hypothetical protein [gamma proteobacterium HdN1]|nr:Conserved hypothetical protein [gamma proteobacterium HdN1]
MSLTHFDDLIQAALGQPQPQTLLMVFCTSELPEDATAAQRTHFERGHGGALAPVVYIDKRANELSTFAALREEAAAQGHAWDMLFVAALSGEHGQHASAETCAKMLKTMVEQVKTGNISRFLAANHNGDFVELHVG